jgi:hypothetical protein
MPGSPVLLIELGWALGSSGDREGAGAAARQAADILKQHRLEHSFWFIKILSLQGLIAVQEGDLEEARTKNIEAIAICESRGDHAEALRHRINLMLLGEPLMSEHPIGGERPRAGDDPPDEETGQFGDADDPGLESDEDLDGEEDADGGRPLHPR